MNFQLKWKHEIRHKLACTQTKISNHRSGGIALDYRNYLENFITPIDTDCPYVYYGLVLRKKYFICCKMLYSVLFIYSLKTLDIHQMMQYQKQNLNFFNLMKKTDYICQVGDFNSRTAKLLDFNEVEESYEFIYTNEIYDVYILDDLDILRLRNNPDDIVHNYGRKLISFCKNNNMLVLNGRVRKDQSSNPTSENNIILDYAISSAHLLRKVEDFEILEFSKLFSDIG